MDYGLQLYSIRITKDDLEGALAQTAEIGYTYVEFAGFSGIRPMKWLPCLKTGLKTWGTHSD